MSSSVKRIEVREARRRTRSIGGLVRSQSAAMTDFTDVVDKSYNSAKKLVRSASYLCINGEDPNFDRKYNRIPLNRHDDSLPVNNVFAATSITHVLQPYRTSRHQTCLDGSISRWSYPMWKYVQTADPFNNPTSLAVKYASHYKADPYVKSYSQYRSSRAYHTYLAGEISYFKAATDRAERRFRATLLATLPPSPWYNNVNFRRNFTAPSQRYFITAVRI